MISQDEYDRLLLEVKVEINVMGKKVAAEINDKISKGAYKSCYLCPAVIDTTEDHKHNLKPFLDGFVHHEYVCNSCIKNGRYERNEINSKKRGI